MNLISRIAPIVVLALTLALGGCSFRPLRGGLATSTRNSGGTIRETLVQGDNPSQATTQTREQLKVRTYVLPAGTRMTQPVPAAATPQGFGARSHVHLREGTYGAEVPPAEPRFSVLNSLQSSCILPGPVTVTEREESRTRTELGAAQKDTARELGARLSSLKGIAWGGVALFTFGLASLFWPPLKVIVASTTTSVAIALGGMALIFLPTLIVGHELVIVAGVALLVGAWFLAHRHGRLRGREEMLNAKG